MTEMQNLALDILLMERGQTKAITGRNIWNKPTKIYTKRLPNKTKGINTLKIQIQQMQERHDKQRRNLQGIHNQELEAKGKEISRLNIILEKAFN